MKTTSNCPHHFPWGGENSTLSSVESPHEASQSGHSGRLGTIGRASGPSHGGGGGVGLCDRLAVKDGSSIKTYIVNSGVSSLLKAELIP